MTDIQRTTALIYATSSRREGIVRLLAGVESWIEDTEWIYSSLLCSRFGLQGHSRDPAPVRGGYH